MKEGYSSLNLTLCVGPGKHGMWEEVIGCEMSGVNIPHGIHHSILNSAESHPLTSCDIRQGSLQGSSLLQRLRKVSSFSQNVKSSTLHWDCLRQGPPAWSAAHQERHWGQPRPFWGEGKGSAPPCRESNKDVPLMKEGLIVEGFLPASTQ